MAISRVIKTLNNLSKAFKIDIGGDFFRERTKDYGKKIQGRLLDGLEGGYDIEGHTFKGLKESTFNIRRSRGINGDRILNSRDGAILGFLQGDNLVESGEVQVKLNNPPHEYMTLQNEGFITGGFLPGRTVPPRKWYGIPKTYREGGTQYELFLNKTIKEINKKITDAINES
jgi:hypothetical protein